MVTIVKIWETKKIYRYRLKAANYKHNSMKVFKCKMAELSAKSVGFWFKRAKDFENSELLANLYTEIREELLDDNMGMSYVVHAIKERDRTNPHWQL
ncbi:hypothetical protein R1flu_011226 [Riccia fluitans]|uniref:Uncharacterized protein n=1 Tax=Riccia fluitans TaxID=41844 RepID=A0ABD1Z9Q8_9MARC